MLFPSGRVMVSHFTFRSAIHLELMSVHIGKQRSRFTFPIWIFNYPAPSMEKTILLLRTMLVINLVSISLWECLGAFFSPPLAL